jgi:type IV pilus assembly protein PilB
VFEILLVDRALRSEIAKGSPREVLQDAIRKSASFRSMEDSLRRLVLEGKTTLAEARKTMTAME